MGGRESFAGKRVLLTGAASGIGRALALDLDDEILKAAAVTHAGAIVHEGVKG